MLIIGLEGHTVSAAERGYLQHPAVAGVILFARNFASKAQLQDLCADIRASASRPQLITVDQEGGRVQRFREGFAKLPCLEEIGAAAGRGLPAALALAKAHAYLMAAEVVASGLDLSFAPVADLGRGNLAIGNRAFSAAPETVAEFIAAYVAGLREAGMAATLKHFPGHGSVLADTHFDDAVDERPLAEIEALDLVPFRAGLAAGADAVMMAHVRYPQVAPEPAGYSPFWIQTMLKQRLGFTGVVFSDDIGMAAAESAGGIAARLHAHYDAGCDSVLVCAPALVPDALAAMRESDLRPDALAPMRGRAAPAWETLVADARWRDARQSLGITAAA